MFWKDSRRRRKRIQTLRNEIADIHESYADALRTADEETARAIYSRIDDESFSREHQLSWLKEQPIRQKAERMGIDISPEWNEVEEFFNRRYARLTLSGKAKVRDLINRKRREQFKWWIEILGLIIGLIIGLIGALTGLVAILRK